MSNYRQMAPAAYLVAALLFFIPFFDALASVAPWHPLAAQWRVGAIGLISKAFLIPPPGGLLAVWAGASVSPYKTQLWVAMLRRVRRPAGVAGMRPLFSA